MIYSVQKLQRLLPDHTIKHCHKKFRLEKLPSIEKVSSNSDNVYILDCTMIPATDRTNVKKFYKNYIRNSNSIGAVVYYKDLILILTIDDRFEDEAYHIEKTIVDSVRMIDLKHQDQN